MVAPVSPFEQRDPKIDPRTPVEDKVEQDDHELLQLLDGYWEEAKSARETGYEPRDKVWERNLDAFWMRHDDSAKKDWQAKEHTPAVPNYVERFSAVNREALVRDRLWFSAKDLKDPSGVMTSQLTNLLRSILDTSGTNATGHPVAFELGFGDHVQSGCLMGMCCAITWKDGRVQIETVDPRDVYIDSTGRGLYRCRYMERDKHQLLTMAAEEPDLYDAQAIRDEVAHWDQEKRDEKDRSSGGSSQTTVMERKPMMVKEWLTYVIDSEGESETVKKQFIVTLNDRTIIRGPEPNPFWHDMDWIVFHPLMRAPLGTVDGKTYVENFVRVAETYDNVMNMILDGFQASIMNAFECNPDVLDSREEMGQGVFPMRTFMRDEDADPNTPLIKEIPIGRPMTGDVFSVLTGIKSELQEAGSQSDVSLGRQVSGETTATEVNASQAGQTALINSVSRDIDMGYLDPVLYLSLMTAIQHVDEEANPFLLSLLNEETLAMIVSRREEFKSRALSVKAKGISSQLEKNQRLRGKLGALNVIGGNPLLVAEFQKKYSLGKFVTSLLEDFGVDIDSISLDDQEKLAALREQMAGQLGGGLGQLLGGAPGGLPGAPAAPGGAQTAQNQGGGDPLAGVEGTARGLGGA